MTVGYSAPRQVLWRAFAIATLLFALLWAGARCEVRFDNLDDAGVRIYEILKGFFPPDWTALNEILPEAGKTIMLGAASTLIGFILSAPLALAAARNIAPSWMRLPVRLLLGLERATPEILILLFFVVAFGLGAFAGILTLGLASVAMLGKLLADAIEEADPAIAESVQATGAHRWQVIRYGILPEVIPALVSNAMFRFDYNMRMTVILGAVGAGGLGQEIIHSISRLHYQRATLAALISLIIIISAEQLTSHVRQSWIGDVRK